MSSLDTLYSARHQAISLQADTTLVLFKNQARQAFRAHTACNRRISFHLTTTSTQAYSFYRAWHDTLLPKLELVDKASDSKALKNSLKKTLLLNNSLAEEMTEKLAKDRGKYLKKEFISAYYLPSEYAARQSAQYFLSHSNDENIEIIHKYIDFLAYKQIAQERNITVYDRWDPYLKRAIQRFWDRNQTKKLIRHTQRKLTKIDHEIKALESMDCNLMASVLSLNIDLVTIAAARQSYEKSLKEQKDELQKNPSIRLELYQNVISKLFPTYLESAPGTESLQDIQRVSQEIDKVLVRVIDLPSRHFNELMTHMKSYRELAREREALKKQIIV